LPEKIDPSLRDVKRLRAALDRNPNDLALATRLARRAIEAARETGDPRFLGQAQSALTPWWTEPNPPAPALLLRATLKQSTHDFDGALADLDRLITRFPNDGQALLTRATVLTVQGRYAQARADCARVARLTVRLVAIACDAAPASVSGEAASAYRALTTALGATSGARNSADLAEWGSTLAGEIAQRRGDATAAEIHFRTALALDPRDPYLLGAYADFLLEQKRPAEVIPLLRDYPRNDSLLLRLALAEARLPDARAAFEKHRADLKDRFDVARRRGDSLHRREEARYTLELAGDPTAALRLARDNWKVQREVADLRILAAAARATGDAVALREATEWAHRNQLEDTTLNALLEVR
jgi:predicted Zn-dependent protease